MFGRSFKKLGPSENYLVPLASRAGYRPVAQHFAFHAITGKPSQPLSTLESELRHGTTVNQSKFSLHLQSVLQLHVNYFNVLSKLISLAGARIQSLAGKVKRRLQFG